MVVGVGGRLSLSLPEGWEPFDLANAAKVSAAFVLVLEQNILLAMLTLIMWLTFSLVMVCGDSKGFG